MSGTLLVRAAVLGLALDVSVSAAMAASRDGGGALGDAESYAVAVCLIGQPSPYLKEQGYGWASVISDGRDRDLTKLVSVRRAVEVELARHHMIVVHDEQSPTRSKDLPIAYCGEIADAPNVRAAIGGVARRLRRGAR